MRGETIYSHSVHGSVWLAFLALRHEQQVEKERKKALRLEQEEKRKQQR